MINIGRITLSLFAALAAIMMAQQATANVRCVQEFLSETSFDPGPIDGLWGRQTEQAASALLDQTDLSVSGGVTRNNADAVCALFNGPDRDKLLRLGRYRIYAITIDPEDLSALTGKRVIDFSDVDVASTVSFDQCRFTIGRKVRSDQREETLASGLLSIDRGNIIFAQHIWNTGGLADETYLHNEARLVIDKDGIVHGRMPFFHMFEVAGQTVAPPLDVELPGTHDAPGAFPLGVTRFPVTSFADGFLDIYVCSGGSTELERPSFPNVEIADDANFGSCFFQFERKWRDNGRVEVMATGQISIEDGYVTFADHSWRTGGMADETFLSGVVLAIDKSGRVHGRMPFFHLFQEPEKDLHPPIIVELSEGFSPGSGFPLGETVFDLDHNMIGRMLVRYCRSE